MLHATIIQHTAADTAGAVMPLLEQLDVATTVVRVDRGDVIPRVVPSEILMTFGAPISLVHGEVPNWVSREKELLRWAIEEGRSVLAVCFGAQLLASVLGSQVVQNHTAEVGWHRVWKNQGVTHPHGFASLPDYWQAFHWHRNTFEMPLQAVPLYQSHACKHQSFQLGDRVVGFQFHFEANARTVRNFLTASDLWRLESESVHDREKIISDTEIYLGQQQLHLERFMQEFIARSA
jgi:GMP synthase-like glutamine amidotransferase